MQVIAGGVYHYGYNAQGHIDTEILRLFDDKISTKYHYDDIGRLRSIKYPDGDEANYQYENNRVMSLTGGKFLDDSFEVSYDNVMNMKQLLIADGRIEMNFEYAPVTQFLTKQRFTVDGKNLLDLQYVDHDPLGNLLKSVNFPFSNNESIFNYDIRGQLQSIELDHQEQGLKDQSLEYSYNAAGDVIRKEIRTLLEMLQWV